MTNDKPTERTWRAITPPSAERAVGITPPPARFGQVIVSPERTWRPVAHPSERSELDDMMPRTFDEARKQRGNAIEDVYDVYDKQDRDSHQMAVLTSLTEKDRVFFSNPEAIMGYEEELLKFTARLNQENPYRPKQEASSAQIGWMQHNSKEYMRSRAQPDVPHDRVVSRIYLNPDFDSMLEVYEAIVTRAEAEGLRFQAKVFDPNMRSATKGGVLDTAKLEVFSKYYAEMKQRRRGDSIVVYGYKESSDVLLGIITDVYKKHQESFLERDVPVITSQIANGLAVGEEPIGAGENDSLSSHRELLIERCIRALKDANPRWSEFPIEMRRAAFCELFRGFASGQHIDPDNIAFNA